MNREQVSEKVRSILDECLPEDTLVEGIDVSIESETKEVEPEGEWRKYEATGRQECRVFVTYHLDK